MTFPAIVAAVMKTSRRAEPDSVASAWLIFKFLVEGGGAAYDFDDFARDAGLPHAIHIQRQLVDHFAGVRDAASIAVICAAKAAAADSSIAR